MTTIPQFTSIGYRTLLHPKHLAGIVRALDATVLDVRLHPRGYVRRGFARADLEALLGDRYEWRGNELGGLHHVPKPADLDRLASDKRRLVLMCSCATPGECHRHRTIAVPLLERGIDVSHVYRQEVILASELQRAIDEDDEYTFTPLADLIGDTSPAALLGLGLGDLDDR